MEVVAVVVGRKERERERAREKSVNAVESKDMRAAEEKKEVGKVKV